MRILESDETKAEMRAAVIIEEKRTTAPKRLEELTQLRDKGLITDKEFKKKRKEVMKFM